MVALDIVEELVHSIGKLKKSARGSAEWHAYQSILNAIVPDEYSLENASALANNIGITYRKVVSVSQRKTRINIDGDWSNTVSKRRDAFEIKYAHFVSVIMAYYENETQQDPSRVVSNHINGNHHIFDHKRHLCPQQVNSTRTSFNRTAGPAEE